MDIYMKEASSQRRTLRGTVVSHKMEKTVVVRVDKVRLHPVYKKRMTVSRRYKAHDPKNACKTGDKVTIVETRPLSKEKKWRVFKKD